MLRGDVSPHLLVSQKKCVALLPQFSLGNDVDGRNMVVYYYLLIIFISIMDVDIDGQANDEVP